VLTSLLYLLVFAHVLEAHVAVYDGAVGYTAFLVPGLVMMAVLQNAFANSSSSLMQSKLTGNLVFVLLPPLSPGELFAAYVLGAMVRRPRRRTRRVPGHALVRAVGARDAVSVVGAGIRGAGQARS